MNPTKFIIKHKEKVLVSKNKIKRNGVFVQTRRKER